MQLKKWLIQKLAGKDADLVIDHEENLVGLNLKEALDVHGAWKDRLQVALNGQSNEELDVVVVAKDDQCALGKWLHGPGKQKYSKLPEYDQALKAHAEFHVCAAEVLIEHQSGNTQQANDLLKTRFRSASNNNQIELVRLFTTAN